MQGKICVVTGATAGMGLETARALARRGATVVGVGRNPEKSAAVAEQIKRQTGNPAVEFLIADLSSQQEIRRLALQIKDRYPRLDVLVNNAGGIFLQRSETVDGLELTWALNHLGYFLMTNLLLDRLEASAPARIVNVSSMGHRRAKINFQDPQGKRGYSGTGAYYQSKLANILFTFELARRLKDKGVTANVAGPGPVATEFAMNNFGPLSGVASVLSKPVYRLIGENAEEGARTAVYLAASPEVEGVTGQYFQHQTPVRSSAASYDLETARSLWDLSAEMTGL